LTPDQTTEIFRYVLREAVLVASPVIVAASLTSLVISLLQTLTSIQDQTLSIVPRLLVVAGVMFVGIPWFFRQLTSFTESLLGNFGRFLDH
jgi:flagellar biosynthetic protein FliQ